MAVTEAGGKGTTADGDEAEAFMDAVHSGNTAMLRTLIEGGADPETQVVASGYYDVNGDGVRDLFMVPALYEGVRDEQADMVRLLLRAGADPNAAGFVYLLEEDPDNPQENIAALFGATEDPNIESGPYRDTPIYHAIRDGNVEIVQMLLSSGADTEIPNRSDETALIAAIQDEEVEIVRLLIEAGANLDVTAKFREQTPLELAEDSRNKEMVKLLKEATQ